MAASPNVHVTKDYRLFSRSAENRPLDQKRHKKLFESMKRYGFLSCFPVVAYRNGEKHLVLKDGQHRLVFAERLQLPVYWMEEKTDFDVALINGTPKPWMLRDFAEKYVAHGLKAYQEGLEFAEQHGLAIGMAFALLGGTTSYSNVASAFVDGTFKVKDRAWADRVATTYVGLVQLSSQVRSTRLLEACMGVCRVEEFNPSRLLQNARRCREKLLSYSTKDAYLDMLETVYNFGRKLQVGLKALATMAMRDRCPINPAKKASPQKDSNAA